MTNGGYWEPLKPNGGAGANAKRLAQLERQAAGIKRSIGGIVQRGHKSSGMIEEQAKQMGQRR